MAPQKLTCWHSRHCRICGLGESNPAVIIQEETGQPRLHSTACGLDLCCAEHAVGCCCLSLKLNMRSTRQLPLLHASGATHSVHGQHAVNGRAAVSVIVAVKQLSHSPHHHPVRSACLPCSAWHPQQTLAGTPCSSTVGGRHKQPGGFRYGTCILVHCG
jgi:hypothetical protein